MKNRIIVLAMLALLLGVNVGAQSAKPVVIASHSILADVARVVAGDHLDVRTLIPAGSDPHHFIPTPSDLAAVADADLVLINGIGYEETLLEAIENAGADVHIVVASACIDVRPAGGHDDHDEHMHDEHAHEDDEHDHEDEHAHDDEHAHEDDDDHMHEDDEHDHDEDDEHAHDDHDDHAHDEDLTGCDAQDAEFYAIGFHDHGKFLGRAEDIECAAHVHGEHEDHDDHDDHDDEHDDHDDEHDEHADEHADEHDDHAHEEGACDPHVWFDPQNVIRWALTIRDSYSEIDPDNASEYHELALAYAAELDSLESDFIWPTLENLPEEKRLLVTAHDALGYLAGTFGFEIVSTVIPGVSTVVEPSASDVAQVIDVIREHELTAIFGESTSSDKVLQVIAAETGVEIASLYTDSLSLADGPAATYLDYMRYNFTTIVEALSG